MKRNELFIITAEAFRALDLEEVDATVKALKELNLYALPYPQVDIRAAGDCITHMTYDGTSAVEEGIKAGFLLRHGDELLTRMGDGYWIDFYNISLENHSYTKAMVCEGVKGFHNCSFPLEEKDGRYGSTSHERDFIANVLIVMLATRNALKTRSRNKLAALGIGKKNRHEWTTLISVPQALSQVESQVESDSSVKRCPHLRRGHIRGQHHGPGGASIKQIWIAPVFVNADPEWKCQRKAYSLKGAPQDEIQSRTTTAQSQDNPPTLSALRSQSST
jgi:hypothetical protein